MNGSIAEEVLKSIQESTDKPSARLVRFKREGTLAIANATGFCGIPGSCGYLSTSSSEFDGLFDGAAIVLRSISLDAWNDHRDRPTAVAANELAIWHAQNPELKRRLSEDEITLKKIGAQPAPGFRRPNRTVGSIIVLSAFAVFGIIGACFAPNNSPSVTADTKSSPVSTASGPTDTNFGTIYLPASASYGLDDIEMQQMQLNFLDGKVKQLAQEIAKDRLTLDTTSQTAVDDFNRKVDRYNALLQEDKVAAAAFDKKVNAYNAELQRHRPQ